jgi:hypothetical protein
MWKRQGIEMINRSPAKLAVLEKVKDEEEALRPLG